MIFLATKRRRLAAETNVVGAVKKLDVFNSPSKMPVGIPAFLSDSWSFLPFISCFLIFFSGKTAAICRRDQRRRSARKTHPEFFWHSLLSYSVRKAVTGSFFAAIKDGIKPEINVSTMLISTKITEPCQGIIAPRLSISVSARTIRLIGKHNR